MACGLPRDCNSRNAPWKYVVSGHRVQEKRGDTTVDDINPALPIIRKYSIIPIGWGP